MGIIKYSRYYSSKWLQRPNSVPTRSTRLCPDAVADSFPRMVGLTTSSLQRLAASTTRRSSLSSLPGPWHGEPTTRRLKLTNFRRKSRKTTRIQKAVVGMSIEEIRRKKAESREDRDKATEQLAKDVKDRKAKQMQAKKADKGK